MTKRPFQKKHLIQIFVGVGVGLLIMAGADLVISLWPGLILVGLGGIIAIAEPRRQTVADWIIRVVRLFLRDHCTPACSGQRFIP